MAASREDLQRWFNEGKERGATHMIVMCDTFDYDDYPKYVMPGQDPHDEVKKARTSMQTLMEVYAIHLGFDQKAGSRGRCMNYDMPPKEQPDSE